MALLTAVPDSKCTHLSSISPRRFRAAKWVQLISAITWVAPCVCGACTGNHRTGMKDRGAVTGSLTVLALPLSLRKSGSWHAR